MFRGSSSHSSAKRATPKPAKQGRQSPRLSGSLFETQKILGQNSISQEQSSTLQSIIDRQNLQIKRLLRAQSELSGRLESKERELSEAMTTIEVLTQELTKIYYQKTQPSSENLDHSLEPKPKKVRKIFESLEMTRKKRTGSPPQGSLDLGGPKVPPLSFKVPQNTKPSDLFSPSRANLGGGRVSVKEGPLLNVSLRKGPSVQPIRGNVTTTHKRLSGQVEERREKLKFFVAQRRQE